jgi:phenylacetate-coenzyme A ligase PaaK-like adenylate-forming protein
MEAARDRRVRATVEHAASHVPYYRDVFRSTGVEAGDIRAAADLERLPLLTRDSVQAAGEELRAILHSADLDVHPQDELPAAQGGKFRHLVPLHGD